MCLESLYQLAGGSPVVVIAREPRSKLLMPPGDWRCESGVGLREGGARWQSVPSRESCSVVIRKRESRTTHFRVKAREEVKNLERSLEELHGVWGAECHHSGYRNKRDLRWSVDHTYRKPCYKPQGETQDDAAGEVGGGHISAESRDNTTRPEERTSAFIGPSGEVSDDACRKRPTPSDR